MEWLEGVLAVLGLTLKNVVAGAVGSFISLRFFDGLNTSERWGTFVGGWGMAAYLASPVNEYLELNKSTELGIALAIGLFGMSIAAALIRVVRETNWSAILNRKTGGGS